MRWGRFWLLTALLAGRAGAAPIFDPAAHKDGAAGPLTRALTIGSPHLSGLPKAFDPKSLAPVVDRLVAWRPQIVTIENLSGAQCDYLQRYGARYRDTFDTYCWDLAPARAATGLDVVAATAEAERLLAAWPAAPTDAQRRHLAAVFVAAGDRASAMVQWLRLQAAGRRTGDGVDAWMQGVLDKGLTARDESTALAAAVAARVGLERVYPVDDHTADAPDADEAAMGAAMQRVWDNPVNRARTAREAPLMAAIGTPEGVLALYRDYNAPDMPRITFDGDFGAAMRDADPKGYGRRYLGWWETRNLRMVANIREAMARMPGARVLSIVGASHKGYYDAYLNLMHDVVVEDAVAVLR